MRTKRGQTAVTSVVAVIDIALLFWLYQLGQINPWGLAIVGGPIVVFIAYIIMKLRRPKPKTGKAKDDAKEPELPETEDDNNSAGVFVAPTLEAYMAAFDQAVLCMKEPPAKVRLLLFNDNSDPPKPVGNPAETSITMDRKCLWFASIDNGEVIHWLVIGTEESVCDEYSHDQLLSKAMARDLAGPCWHPYGNDGDGTITTPSSMDGGSSISGNGEGQLVIRGQSGLYGSSIFLLYNEATIAEISRQLGREVVVQAIRPSEEYAEDEVRLRRERLEQFVSGFCG